MICYLNIFIKSPYPLETNYLLNWHVVQFVNLLALNIMGF